MNKFNNSDAISTPYILDKNDFLLASGCGVVASVVDIFLVGAPRDSMLEKWSDEQADKLVLSFAKKLGWKPSAKAKNNIASAIGFLERKYSVNYDQRYTSDVDGLFNMSTKNHHLKSLPHSSDVVGLFFSILNQFTSTSTFLSDGQLITIKTKTSLLQGHDFKSKLFCGCANWFGHIMSDLAGSSGGRGNATGRGTGVALPFFEFFQLCNFGSFSIGDDKQTLATLATRVFQEGYDLRYGVAMGIPVLISDLLVRLVWAIKAHFICKLPLKDCLPIIKQESLVVMLTISYGTLCAVDLIDAVAHSHGNALKLSLRLNIVAWYSLTNIVIRTWLIKLKINIIDDMLDFYKNLDYQLGLYLTELNKINFNEFYENIDEYDKIASSISTSNNEDELNRKLLEAIENIPWKGTFDEFMSNQNNSLVFE